MEIDLRSGEVCLQHNQPVRLSDAHGLRVICTAGTIWITVLTQRRALRNMRIHGESSPQFSGCQDICTVRKTRSGCGIMIVKRPSAVVTAVKPPGEPFGLYG
jgi:hypothetical protein